MASNDNNNNNGGDIPIHSFQIGDRIVVRNLVNAKHLNDCHGVIALVGEDRVGVDLDLYPGRRKVKPSNLEREADLTLTDNNNDNNDDDDDENQPSSHHRAAAVNNILIEVHGRAISMILDEMRAIAAPMYLSDESIQSSQDVDDLRNSGPRGMLKLNHLTALSWSNWSPYQEGSHPTNQSMYKALVKRFREEVAFTDGTFPPFFTLAQDSLDQIHAAGGWHVRLHGNFWIVGYDKEGGTGTYLIPEESTGAVYKVLGVRTALGPMIENHEPNVPCLFTATMIPWYGRLIYDGVVIPAGGMMPGQPRRASAKLAARLRANVQKAIAERRVVERWAQLEVPGGTRIGPIQVEGEEVANTQDPTEQQDDQTLDDPTPQEQRCIDAIQQFEAYPLEDPHGSWVMRRMDYTERENPNHMGLVMVAGSCLGSFFCSALIPTALDILQDVAQKAQQVGRRPAYLGVDDQKCAARVKHLLRNMEGTLVEFYRPPSKEEQSSVMSNPLGWRQPTAP